MCIWALSCLTTGARAEGSPCTREGAAWSGPWFLCPFWVLWGGVERRGAWAPNPAPLPSPGAPAAAAPAHICLLMPLSPLSPHNADLGILHHPCLGCPFLSSLLDNRPASKKHPHLPSPIAAWLSSLSSLGDSAPERRSPGHHRQPSDSTETTGLVQRCVIIQKDEHGFGFTVSGDRIVLVQSVRPGGAAMRAGVQEGDRIVKVNGTMVTNSSHLEVVKLIKSGAYVALTLLGSPPSSVGLSNSQQDASSSGAPRVMPTHPPPPPPPPPLPPPQRITGPKPLQDPEVQKHATQILRNMLRQEEAELQRFCEVYSRRPATGLEGQIEGARRRVSQLQLKILQETGSLVDCVRLSSDPGSAGLQVTEGRLSLDSQDGDSGLDSGTERFPSVSEISLNRNSVLSDPGLDSPRTSPIITSKMFQHHRRQGSDTPFAPSTEQGSDRTLRPLIIGPEEDYDPGYFNNECDSLFQDLGKLKSRPAHLGVFLRYIFSQADPSPLLFYLCADVCQKMNPKESRALGKDIWNIFLEKNAALRVKVADSLLLEIESRLRNGEDIRSALSEAQDTVMPEIQEQIQDYRTKRTMGLGSLYGENDLMDLDGDPQRERQVAEKQITQLGDILSKYEDDRSSPMAFALRTYVTHAGIRGSEPRPASTSEKSQSLPDKDKWLPFFPKTKKQSSGTKKDKDTMEDKKRNPILKYIGKPKSSSQSTFHVPLSPVEVKPGNVRNIIQHFENNQHYESQEPGTQRLSTGSFPEDLLETDSSRLEVKLGRSESLKGREEMKKSRKAENVPRSRSDVDMDAAAEATRLHQSASSSASSLSTRSLENPTPPYTPKMGRRSIESPNLGFGTDSFLPHLLEDDLGQLSDLEPEPDTQNWQHTMGREVTAYLTQKEIDRQEVINELFATEASHLRILRVLDVLFYQRLKKESLLSREELALLFPNLPDLIEIHNSLCESMKKLREEGPIIKEIGDLMLSRFDGPAREEIQQVAADFCAYQSIALELIKTKQRKETRFQIFMQEAESNPQCRRLQLKDLIISEMQRLTKYPLLLENVLKHTEGGTPEHEKLSRARDQCREILRHVNEAVKRAENRHRLEAYQKRLDATSLERTSNPLAAEFKNLDLTSRRMIHEGPLSWRISKDKTVDLHVLLLEDLLVLLQKQDEKLVLKCHSKTALGSADTKQTFSPVLKLNSVLIRSVATDKRALFIICTSELGPQIYELVALTSSEKNAWMELLEEAVQSAMRNATFPPKPRVQEPTHRPAPSSLVLQDAEGSPLLAQGSNSGAEMEEVSSADNNPGDFLGKEKPPLQQEEPEAEGSEGMAGEEEEEEEEELPAAPVPALPPAEPDDVHPQRPDPDMHLALPEPALGKGLAESALADVENLRHLLLRSLLPCRDPEPEDDLTPTPSVIGGAVQPWDAALPSQDPPVEPTGQEGKICPASSGTGPEPGDWLDAGAAEGTSPVGLQEAEMSSSAEGQSGLKVVRKAEVEGTNPAMLLPGGNQSETALREGGRANVDGNYFYVSMPAESSTEPEHPTSPTSPSAAPCTHSPTSRRKEMGPCPSSLEGPPEPPAPGLAIRDVDLIFQVIEQLILKLGQLKDVEAAHQELLQSLGQGSSADATPVGAAAPEADAWPECPPSPVGSSPSARRSPPASEPGCEDPR
ncbi:PREDICTED: rho guanine nucleotide exchange factor 11 isoform X7 [Crocodylus porosus]|uniref:rho guanine nucleotide exchange factor 11 isoform X7 n=1 Tax=Crocodylus porosus TaxID=8502 RepID=UPI000938B04F|nr:PREDICTED: rho guanine nucleotide exchange factor 11 isoform X7 [Crocodylus porosus]